MSHKRKTLLTPLNVLAKRIFLCSKLRTLTCMRMKSSADFKGFVGQKHQGFLCVLHQSKELIALLELQLNHSARDFVDVCCDQKISLCKSDDCLGVRSCDVTAGLRLDNRIDSSLARKAVQIRKFFRPGLCPRLPSCSELESFSAIDRSIAPRNRPRQKYAVATL